MIVIVIDDGDGAILEHGVGALAAALLGDSLDDDERLEDIAREDGLRVLCRSCQTEYPSKNSQNFVNIVCCQSFVR